jgi:hypothetical protein
MQTEITVRDELATGLGTPITEFVLELPNNYITVRELIRQRIEQEIAAYNAQQASNLNSFMQLQGQELLNPQRPAIRTIAKLNVEQQLELACSAFERNGLLILIDERQVDHLDDYVNLNPQTVVTFLKLVPLVGG